MSHCAHHKLCATTTLLGSVLFTLFGVCKTLNISVSYTYTVSKCACAKHTIFLEFNQKIIAITT